MHRKKLDSRIRVLIENGITLGHRSLFVIVGDKARDSVVILYHILTNAALRRRPTVLWCYKKQLGFTTNRQKRMKMLQKKMQAGKAGLDHQKPFDLFVASTQIRYCYYSETHKILGNTYGMLVLQDFEAITPNLLARTIETIEGGGIVVILLSTLSSLRQLYTMTMDVHARYRTEAHRDVVCRFNERFILSLASCQSCCVLDDELNILPISSHVSHFKPASVCEKEAINAHDTELAELVTNASDSVQLQSLLKLCKTLDQAKVVLKLLGIVAENNLKYTVSLTAARGRGKSAALGLVTAGAVSSGFSNIFVTSPSPENLKTFFQFVFKGLEATNYQEHVDFDIVQSTNPEFNKAIVRVNIRRSHRQTIQYIHPTDASKLGQAEMVIIDEAAAIPLPHVKQLLGPYLVFMASTINGYEGTGRSLSLKLLKQLRDQTACISGCANKEGTLIATSGRVLHELTLDESIRYKPGDPVELWLNQILCLDARVVSKVSSGCPAPADCDLYYVNRDTLFCFHKVSECFLQRLMAIYVAAHYKNTPNDLQMLSDAPAHHIFVLLGPVDANQSNIPEVLCVLQVCLEGNIEKSSVDDQLSKGKRSSGDLIPWTVAQQFQDSDFPSLSGGRIVRIATNPDYQNMGYGTRAVQLLQQYYQGAFSLLEQEDISSQPTLPTMKDDGDEPIAPRKNLPPLLAKLSERRAERLNWLGVCYGLTSSLQKFWARSAFTPIYVRQTANELTGEFSCIMLKCLDADHEWLKAYRQDFCRRFISLLGYQFRSFPVQLCLGLLAKQVDDEAFVAEPPSREELNTYFTNYDLKRLEMYSRNLVDHHLITDLLPTVARLYFTRRMPVELNSVQAAILLAFGLQHRCVDDLVAELNLPSSQLLALFNRTIIKCYEFLNQICERAIEADLKMTQHHHAVVTSERAVGPLDAELQRFAKEVNKKADVQKRQLISESELAMYRIHADEDDAQFTSDKFGFVGRKKNKMQQRQALGNRKKKTKQPRK